MRLITSNRAGDQERIHSYICRARLRQPAIQEQLPCDAPYVQGPDIDAGIWNSICGIIADPEIVTGYIDKMMDDLANDGVRSQLAHVERQLDTCERENERWDQAYAAEVFSLDEYKEKKLSVAAKRDRLVQELDRLQEEQSQVTDYERQKELFRQQMETLQQAGIGPDIPFADKRRIVGLLVDKIVIDTQEQWYQLEGAITGAQNSPTFAQGHSGDFTCMIGAGNY